jgi:hypothetical protein
MKSEINNKMKIRSSSKYRLSDDYDNNSDNFNSSHRKLENITDENSWEINIDDSISLKHKFQSIQKHRSKITFSSLKNLTDDLSLCNVDEDDDFRDNKLDHYLIVHSIEDNTSVQYSISSDVTKSFSNSSLSDDNSDKCSFEKESDDDDAAIDDGDVADDHADDDVVDDDDDDDDHVDDHVDDCDDDDDDVADDHVDDDDDDDRPLCRIAALEPIPSFMNFNSHYYRVESHGNFAYFNDV